MGVSVNRGHLAFEKRRARHCLRCTYELTASGSNDHRIAKGRRAGLKGQRIQGRPRDLLVKAFLGFSRRPPLKQGFSIHMSPKRLRIVIHTQGHSFHGGKEDTLAHSFNSPNSIMLNHRDFSRSPLSMEDFGMPPAILHRDRDVSSLGHPQNAGLPVWLFISFTGSILKKRLPPRRIKGS